MRVRLKRPFRDGQYRYRKTDEAGIEMPKVTEIPSDLIPSDAEVLVGNEWKVNNPEKAGKVERELVKPLPVLGPREQVAQQQQDAELRRRLDALEKENAELRQAQSSKDDKKSDDKKPADKASTVKL